MYRRNQNLIENRGINGDINCQDPAISNDTDAAINFIIANGGLLPNHFPFEMHPYLNTYNLQNFSKYIIGTFPPISYLIDKIDNPNIPHLIKPANGGNLTPPNTPFYHGNVDDLWRLFLTAQEFLLFKQLPRAIRRDHLINKLIDLEINYSDIISTVQRKSYKPDDSELRNICPNLDLIEHILNNQNAKYLMFDTSNVFNTAINNLFNLNGIIGDNELKSFELFLKVLQDLGFRLEVDFCSLIAPPNGWHTFNAMNAHIFQQHYRKKVCTKLRITANKSIKINESSFEKEFYKEFVVITSASPSGNGARAIGRNPIYINWVNLNPDYPANGRTLVFRRHIYQLFRAGNWDALQAMNI
jgi:hypothetical protein